MKEYLATLVRASPDPAHGRNVAREYLQARILGGLQRAGAMIPLAFQGGTCLRFLYFIPRYSEALEFVLERLEASYDLRGYLRTIRSALAAEGYAVELRLNDRRAVHSALVRFTGLLHELDLSPHRDEVLAVRIEVDTRPPAGAGLSTTLTRRHVTLRLQHHDRASLLAGKLHAVLQRPFLKGRDVYDLLWYLSDPQWPPPNLLLLNNALRQTGWTGVDLDQASWRGVVRDRLQTIPWERMLADVRPFLESGAEAELLTREHVLRLLG